MALHQSGVQALSLGSEANVGNDQALCLLQEHLPDYERVIVWFDNRVYAQQIALRIGEIGLFRKEKMRTFSHELDANDLLMAGELGEVVDINLSAGNA